MTKSTGRQTAICAAVATKRAEFARLAALGHTGPEIAEMVGAPRGTVTVWAFNNGVTLAHTTTKRAAANKARLAAAYVDGMTAEQLATTAGFSKETAYRWAQASGVALATPPMTEHPLVVERLAREARYADLADLGMTAPEIAKECGTSLAPVGRWAARVGRILPAPSGRASKSTAALAARRARFIELADQGMTSAQIAAATGEKRATVTDWANGAGRSLSTDPGRTSTNPEVVQARRVRFVEMADAGATAFEIAMDTGVGANAVQTWAKRANIVLATSNGNVSNARLALRLREARYAELAEQGWSSREIAKDAGVNYGTVARWAKREDVRLGHGNTAIVIADGREFSGWSIGTAEFRNAEDPYRDQLADHLGGITEVTVPFGRADVMTPIRVIEVEPIFTWPHGAVQAVGYQRLTGLQGILAIVGKATPQKVVKLLTKTRALGLELMWWDGLTWVEINANEDAKPMPAIPTLKRESR